MSCLTLGNSSLEFKCVFFPRRNVDLCFKMLVSDAGFKTEEKKTRIVDSALPFHDVLWCPGFP